MLVALRVFWSRAYSPDPAMQRTDLHGIPVDEALRVLAREFELWRQAQAELARAGIASVPPIGALAMSMYCLCVRG